jgi:sugar (pentulose or hexulose) kinase
MADVFDAEVYRFEVTNSAALGAAIRAFHADCKAEGRPISWDEAVAGLTGPVTGSRIAPRPEAAAVYRGMRRRYAEFERESLARA